MHVHPPHLYQSYLRPPPLLLLFELQGSLVSGPAGVLLDDRAVAEWGGGGWRAVSVEVGRAGGQAAAVIPEGPGFSAEVRCCAPVNRHVEREGGKTGIVV